MNPNTYEDTNTQTKQLRTHNIVKRHFIIHAVCLPDIEAIWRHFILEAQIKKKERMANNLC
jgi:hypothetical protein